MKNNDELRRLIFFAIHEMVEYNHISQDTVNCIHYIDIQDNVVTFMTQRPGLLTGKAGTTIDRLNYIIETRLNGIYRDLDVSTTGQEAMLFLNGAREMIREWKKVELKLLDYNPFYPEQCKAVTLTLKRHSPQKQLFYDFFKNIQEKCRRLYRRYFQAH